MKFVQARRYSRANRGAESITLIVLHTMEAPEGPATAENVAAWFAGPNAPDASTHYNVDVDSVVQSVREQDIAWHADPANGYSIGVEHAGYAKQSPEEWLEPYSRAMLERSAELVADICRRYAIPVARVTADDLRAGRRRGICGHADVTNGLRNGKGHWDPGPHFPWEWYLARVADYLARFDWVEVDCGGTRWRVAPTYRAPIGIGEAVELAKSVGSELPTPKLVDAIYAAADLKLAPITLSPNKGDDAGQFAEHRARVDAAIAGRSFRLLAGTHKDVVQGPDGRVGLYGWHRLDGSPIQPFFAGHAPSWKDYSQGLRLIRRVESSTTSSAPIYDLTTVRGVQARLRDLGFDPGPIDGIRGPKTIAAVRAFQLSRGLVVDGIVGPMTRSALLQGTEGA